MCISNQCVEHIDLKVDETPVPNVFKLTRVLQLLNHQKRNITLEFSYKDTFFE